MFEEQWAVNVEVSCRMPASSRAKLDRNSAQQVRDAEAGARLMSIHFEESM
jgi:hypothetical protein